MLSLKRAVLGGLAASAAALAFAIPAQAAAPAGAACTIQGHADASVNWDSNTGVYTFKTLSITCAGALVDPAASPAPVDVVDLDVTSIGDFNNIVCGTGEAADADPTVNS